MHWDKKRNVLLILVALFLFLTSVYTYGGTWSGLAAAGKAAGWITGNAVNAVAGKAAGGAENSADGDAEYGGVIRFHVVANSDSEDDQTLKLAVRDRVLAAVNEQLVGETIAKYGAGDGDTARLTLSETRALLLENLSVIEEIAEETAREHGYDYKAKAELGVRWIPEKTYGDARFPAGNYEALNITLGKGEGHNWWCVLFPPLCIIDPDGEMLAEAEAGDRSIHLKFKTQELAEKFF